jgi:hypothetical protein
MELWLLIDGWLVEHRHLLPKPNYVTLKVSASCGLAWLLYKNVAIIAIRSDHVIVMPPTTEYFTIQASDPSFWHRLLAAIDRCVDQMGRI